MRLAALLTVLAVHASEELTIPGVATTYKVLQAGTGDKVVAKKNSVTVHATGTVVETGKKFWSTKDPGQQPFTYNAGVNQVITGWDQGCLGMKIGEIRRNVVGQAV